MEWTTHALSGVALGYTVTNDWKLALVSGLFAVIPDLDEPKSKFGKPFFFISFPINQIFGHRTLTHSLLFTAVLGLTTVFFSPLFSIAAMLGILAHIIGDMLTGKVQLLYPCKLKLGISVSRTNYLLMDRIVRVITLLLVCVFGYQEISSLLGK